MRSGARSFAERWSRFIWMTISCARSWDFLNCRCFRYNDERTSEQELKTELAEGGRYHHLIVEGGAW
jgi:hypothetical protein